jgi:predicted RNase H-like HicB family nuclease
MKYTIIIEKGRESGYVVYAPALKNIRKAMEAYIKALLEDVLPVV